MLKPLDKRIRIVRLRCSVNLLLRHAGRVLVAGGIVAVLTVLVERLLALTVITPYTFWGFWAVVMVLLLTMWLLKQPSRMQASLLLDERLGFDERFSTTLALADVEGPFADAARREAYDKASRADINGHFPIRPSKSWTYALSMWLTFIVLARFMPQKDLLGFLRKQVQEQQKTEQLEQAKVDVKEAANPVKSTIEQLGRPELADALSNLDKTLEGAEPQEIKRQAIRKLSDLSDKIQKMQNSEQLKSVKTLQNMFKQLRGSSDPFSQKMRLALAKGNFAQASELLRKLQKDIAQGKISEQQQNALAGQLGELGKRLAELARKNSELEKELEKLGLDSKLADLSQEQLSKALQKQGLSGEQIEKLMQKAAASQLALSQCAGLGNAMAGCAGGGGGSFPDGLASITEQLDEFDSLEQQLMLMEFSLAEINNAIADLGNCTCGMCGNCLGRQIGNGGGYGEGIGTSPGPHYLADPLEQSGTKKTRAPSKVGDGPVPVIASWYFHGTQVKGEAQRDLTEVIQVARDSAAEAISDNQIPRRYEDAIKSYFGRLEQSETE